jgi:hypothetical protein
MVTTADEDMFFPLPRVLRSDVKDQTPGVKTPDR